MIEPLPFPYITGWVRARVMERLWLWPHHATTTELIDYVYEHGEREPDWAASCIHRTLWLLKNEWLPKNLPWLTIVHRSRRWRLVLQRPPCYSPRATEAQPEEGPALAIRRRAAPHV